MNINQQTFHISLPHSKRSEQSFVDFLVYDEDLVGTHDLCGRTTGENLFLRDTKFEDYLSHDLYFHLAPQGKLLVRVTRLGEIADVDYWVMKAGQLLNFAAEDMVRVYVDKVRMPFSVPPS
jgi:hypothetical protein